MVAKTKAELMKRLRDERKAAGLCPYCGQTMPKKAKLPPDALHSFLPPVKLTEPLTETDINTIAQLHNVAPSKVRQTLKEDGFKVMATPTAQQKMNR